MKSNSLKSILTKNNGDVSSDLSSQKKSIKDKKSPSTPHSLYSVALSSKLITNCNVTSHYNNPYGSYNSTCDATPSIHPNDSIRTNTTDSNNINKHEEIIVLNTSVSDTSNISTKKEANSKKPKITAKYIATQLMELHSFAILDDQIHIYNDDLGYYMGLTALNAQILLRKYIPEKFHDYVNSITIQEILHWLNAQENLIPEKKDIHQRQYCINFKNGYLDLRNNQLYSHNPYIFFTGYIQSEYNSYATNLDNAPYFNNFLNQICNGDYELMDLLQEITGYAISEYRGLKLFYYLFGPSNTGKSTYLNLLEHLIGKQFCSNVSLHDLNSECYRATLRGKKLNTCGEIGEIPFKRLDLLKMLTGNDPIPARAKYENPCTFSNNAMLIFAGNLLPNISTNDSGQAFINRLKIIPFYNTIPISEQTHDLLERMLDESEYIVKWALEGLYRLLSNNQEYSYCEMSENLKASYARQLDSISHFIEENCVFVPNCRIYTQDLYTAYCDFCDNLMISPITQKSFTHYIRKNYSSDITYTKYRDGERNQNGFIGITIYDA